MTEATALAEAAPSASVALDIGGGRGALVIYPSEAYRGREIEISRADDGARRVHTGVHDRSTGMGTVLTAVFGSLATGDYLIWADASSAGPRISVPDGAVVEVELA